MPRVTSPGLLALLCRKARFAAFPDPIRFLQTSACLVIRILLLGAFVLIILISFVYIAYAKEGPSVVHNGSEHFEIVDSDPPFGLVRFEKFQDNEHFFFERILRRIIRQELDLGYEVIPSDIAHDDVHSEPLSLRDVFFLGDTCSLLLPTPVLLTEALAKSNR